jgi:hypothetical protein
VVCYFLIFFELDQIFNFLAAMMEIFLHKMDAALLASWKTDGLVLPLAPLVCLLGMETEERERKGGGEEERRGEERRGEERRGEESRGGEGDID